MGLLEEKEVVLTPEEAARQIQFLGYLNNKMRFLYERKKFIERSREYTWNQLTWKGKIHDLQNR